MLGVRPEALYTCRISMKLGLLEEETVIDGALPQIKNFALPEIIPIVFGPRLFHSLVRKYLVRRPAVDMKRCILCGECRKYCPAQAITEEKTELSFDSKKCIRCYCCLEVCPRGAIFSKGAVAAKLVDMYFKKRRMMRPEPESKQLN
jgi:Fe-S-cluster-containing hydrogenase component 2